MIAAAAKFDALVLAGGLGSRLAEVLGSIPKVLAPIEGRPFLDYQLQFLADAGVRRVVLSLGYRAEMVLEHLVQTKLPLKVDTVVEPRPLGTAGAIAFARPTLTGDPVFVLNGDTWLDIDLNEMLHTHLDSPVPLGTIACVRVSDTRRYGLIEVSDGGYVNQFNEKDESRSGEGLVNAGVYVFSARFLDFLTTAAGSSLERDVLPRLETGTLRAHLTSETNFLDIGTPTTYALAAAHFSIRTTKPGAEGGA